MPILSLRETLDYLWDHQYTLEAIGAEIWRVYPPQAGIGANRPSVVASGPILADLATLHQMLESQAIAQQLLDISARIDHAGTIFQRLGWTRVPYGDSRWKLIAPEGMETHSLHGEILGAPRLWTSALDLERSAIEMLHQRIIQIQDEHGDVEK